MFTAIVDETKCVGCSRCIPACPVDAIVGSLHQSHTVLTTECIGCKLCVNPCPVDCIEIKPLSSQLPAGTPIDKQARAQKAKARHQARHQRLLKQQQSLLPVYGSETEKKSAIQSNIQAALLRHKQKKQMERLTSHAID